MHELNIDMIFKVHNKAQAKFIRKQIQKVREQASKLSLTESSRMNTAIRKIDK